MGKHTLESDSFNQWRMPEQLVAEYKQAKQAASPSTEVRLGSTTLEAFNAIVQRNFETEEKPTLKQRMQKAGKTIIGLFKSTRLDYTQTKYQQSFTINAEKQAVFAKDRENARARARADMQELWSRKPVYTESGKLILEGNVVDQPEISPELDDALLEIAGEVYHGVSSEAAAEYNKILKYEANNLSLSGAANAARVHLFTHGGIDVALNPQPLHQQNALAMMRSRIQRDEEHIKDFPRDKFGRVNDEYVAV